MHSSEVENYIEDSIKSNSLAHNIIFLHNRLIFHGVITQPVFLHLMGSEGKTHYWILENHHKISQNQFIL